MKESVIGIFKKGGQKQEFLRQQQEYAQKLKDAKKAREKDVSDLRLVGKSLNPFESMIISMKHKVDVGPEKTFEEL